MKFVALYTLLAILFVAPLFAQDAQKMETPAGQKQLDLFLGSWEGDGTYEEGGNKMEFTMMFTAEHVVEGKAIEMNPHADLGDMGPYSEKNFIAWDPMLNQVTLLVVSNMGEVGQYNGNWVKGKTNTLKLNATKSVGKDEYVMEQTITFLEDDNMTWHASSYKNGETAGNFNATYTKQ